MKNLLWSVVLLGCLFTPACGVAENQSAYFVRHVLDGDTLILGDGERVRLIGIDTPEIHDDQHRNAAHAARYGQDPGVMDEYAFKAKEFSREAVEGQKVRLEYDWQRKDKFGRTLAYVYRASDNFFLNAEVLKQGYGFAYTRFPFKYEKEFRGYEAEARRTRQGLWG